MITNASLTVYHKDIDEDTKLEVYTRYNYDRVWWFGGRGSRLNKGYENANDLDVRISYELEPDIKNFAIGDILVKGNLDIDILHQQDLSQYDVYNITSINDNTFGSRPHIHLGGK